MQKFFLRHIFSRFRQEHAGTTWLRALEVGGARESQPRELPPPDPRQAAFLRRRTLLLADDSAPARKIMAAFLTEAGAFVVQASHGQEALDMLAAMPHCDAVLMDIDMPGMDGLEATRAIRRGPAATRSVPVIALTAHSTLAMTNGARDAGMNGFVAKPADADSLREVLAPLLPPEDASAPRVVVEPMADDLLLDIKRLEGCARVGVLHEISGEYLEMLPRLIDEVESRLAAADPKAAKTLLHSLLGSSGNAGLRALRAHLYGVYRMVENGRWPDPQDWLPQARELAALSDAALRAYCARDMLDPAPPIVDDEDSPATA